MMENLSGHFLISTPQMPDPRFKKQVIYLCAHNDEGAMGVVINNPNQEISMLEVMSCANLPLPEHPLPPVYMGGPVERDAGFILYSSVPTIMPTDLFRLRQRSPCLVIPDCWKIFPGARGRRTIFSCWDMLAWHLDSLNLS